MVNKKNIFISHVHEDDALLPDLKKLLENNGMEVSDKSISSENPNDAKNEHYIKYDILAPRIERSSTLIVLITDDTAYSDYVNWEIRYAVQLGKKVIGVFAHGATDASIPEELGKCGDAAIVGWQGQRVVDAINGNILDWDDPNTGKPRSPEWRIRRYGCN